MNVYDFDGTIYDGDSTFDFYKYCMKRHPGTLKSVPGMIFAFCLYIVGIYSKTEFKEKMYGFLKYVGDVDKEVENFWDKNRKKIKKYYLNQKKESDVIISASPEFLLEPICNYLGVEKMMASVVDKKTGHHTGINCHDSEKVRRLYEWRENAHIDEFYSDSLADTPLAEISDKAYMVKGEKLTEWSEYKPPKYKMFLTREFITFLVIGVINTFAGSLFALFYRSFIPNDTVAFIPGFITGNVLSYFLNAVFTFKDKDFKIIKYLKFLLSNLPNLLIQTLAVQLFSVMLELPSFVAYVLAAVVGVPLTFALVKVFAFTKKK